MIYLASPYSHPDWEVRKQRFEAAVDFVTQHLIEGIPLFSPIVYGHPISQLHPIGTDFETWQMFNDSMLARSDSMWVLQLDGWKESRGVAYEITQAQNRLIPIEYRGPLC